MSASSTERRTKTPRRAIGRPGSLAESVLGEVLPALQARHGVSAPTPAEPVRIPAPSPAPSVPMNTDSGTTPLDHALALACDTEWRRAAENALGSPESQDRAALRARILAPAARRLGRQWSDDEASLADVTIGLGRLQWLLDAAPGAPRDGSGPRVLLTPTPNDGHVFGLALLAEELREAGFAVEVHSRPTAAGIARAVALRSIAVLGIGISVSRHAGRAAVLVRAAKRGARGTGRPAPLVIAGGAGASDTAPLLRSAGVDAILDGSMAPAAWLTGKLWERAAEGDGPVGGLEKVRAVA